MQKLQTYSGLSLSLQMHSTLDISDQDLLKRWKQSFFKTSDILWVCLAANFDDKANSLEEIVVEMWLAGILKVIQNKSDRIEMTYWYIILQSDVNMHSYI